ncbi:MAG: hypothetical protein ABL903_03740 [Methylococcales bacterium]
MNKLLSFIILLSVMSFTPVVYSESSTPALRTPGVEVTDPGFVLLDVLVYRPVGLVATLVGGAVFAGISPLTALASIPAPHDAFNKTFNVLVLAPAAYTFIRPVGERRFVPGYIPQYRTRPVVSPANSKTFKRTEPFKQLPAVP